MTQPSTSSPTFTSSRPLMVISRAGFSLLELLVVIGILTVLIALAVIGFKVVGTASKEKVTINQLENCKSLLNAFELTSSVGSLFPTPPVATGHWVAPATGTIDASTCTTAAQGNGSDDLILQDTARVLNKLRTVPANKQSIEKMSPDRLRYFSFGAIAALPLPAGEGLVLNDGFGYPIYFVPGGGLSNVKAGYNGGDKSVSASYEKYYTAAAPLRAPDRRPFWVSPGPDGDLTTGDDNLYSFGK